MYANDTKNVSVGKGVKGGYLFAAPVGTPLPTAYDTTAEDLDPAFENLGFLTEDGINNPIESDSESFPDMNGDTIESAGSTYTETLVFTLAEQKRASLAQEYGNGNVTDVEGQITAHHNSLPKDHMSYVMLLILKDGRRQTSVAKDGQVTEVGEKQYNSTNLVAREVTVTCYPDENGDCVVDYIESTETKPPFIKQVKAGQPVLAEPFEGKALGELVGDNYAVTYKNGVVKATGDVYKVDAWKAYGKEEQGKYYPVFRIDVPAGTEIETTTLSKKQRKLTFDGPDDLIVAMDENAKTREFTLTDPSDKTRTSKLVFDATECTFTTKE